MTIRFSASMLAALSVPFMLAISSQAALTSSGSIFERQASCPVHTVPATFFCSGTSPTGTTACGNTYDRNAPGVAISTLLIADSEECEPPTIVNCQSALILNSQLVAPYCGLNVVIGDFDNGNEILAPIIDLCATCTDSPFHIDLS